MKHKCELCKEEISTTFLDKIKGTILKIGKKENAKTHYICSNCQKKHGKELKEKLTQ